MVYVQIIIDICYQNFQYQVIYILPGIVLMKSTLIIQTVYIYVVSSVQSGLVKFDTTQLVYDE